MLLFKRYIRRETQALIDDGVRVRFIVSRGCIMRYAMSDAYCLGIHIISIDGMCVACVCACSVCSHPAPAYV